METVKIGDLLTEVQVAACISIVKIHRKPVDELKKYLAQFKDELEKKGADSDFLAYMIHHIIVRKNLTV